jgi:hypothetical protein
MESAYGINFDDRCGEAQVHFITVMPEIASAIMSDGVGAEIWLDNVRGHMRLSRKSGDRTYARVFSSRAEKAAATNEDILKVAYPSGHFKMFYPLTFKDSPPFEGRQWSIGQADCYRLIIDYYKRELGIKLLNIVTPDNYLMQSRSYQGQNLFLTSWQLCGFEPVMFPQHGDGILMRVGRGVVDGPDHCGVYLNGDRILHHFYNRLSTIQEFAGTWRESVYMFLRHKDRM